MSIYRLRTTTLDCPLWAGNIGGLWEKVMGPLEDTNIRSMKIMGI